MCGCKVLMGQPYKYKDHKGAKRKGSGRMSNKGDKYKNKEDGVEELLRAAEDEMLLKLNLDGHLAHTSSPLDQDLIHRFKALKSQSNPSEITRITLPPKRQQKEKSKEEEEELGKILGADLSARFAALKGSSSFPEFQVNPNRSDDHHDKGQGRNDEDDGVSEDEVEKVIQWAMDAARLDPSRSDDEEEDDDDDDGGGGKRPHQK